MYRGIMNINQIKELQNRLMNRCIKERICFNFVTTNGICGIYGYVIHSLDKAVDGSFFTADIALESGVPDFYSVHNNMKLMLMLTEDNESSHPDGIVSVCAPEEYNYIRDVINSMHDQKGTPL